MPPYRLAHLTPDQMLAIESMEDDLGVTLVAYEPAAAAVRDDGSARLEESANDLVLDGLVDTYRTYDPQIDVT